MSNKRILINATPTEKRVALLENDKALELIVERPDSMRMVGNIYRGTVVSILPGIQAAFIDLGMGKSAFLHASDVDPSLFMEDAGQGDNDPRGGHNRRKRVARIPIEKVLQKGQPIVVQVIKEPIGTKGPKVTTQVSIAGRFLVLIPDTDFIGVSKQTSDSKKRQRLKRLINEIKPKNVGFIVRTIGLKVSETEFVAETHALLDKWKNVQESALEGSGIKLIFREMGIVTSVMRDLFADDVTEVFADDVTDYNEIVDYLRLVSPDLIDRVKLYTGAQPLFDAFNIEKDLERSLKRKVWLRCGGYILFDHAEALLAIDVNTGRNVGKRSHEETIFVTNIEAAREIGRQLRLRDIGGLIVVDFIDMRDDQHNRKLEDEMHNLLEADPSATDHTSISKFGLMEITRHRVRPELQELFTDECKVCSGLGWVFSPATVTTRIDRWLQRAASQNITGELTLALPPSVAAYLKQDNGLVIKKLEQEHALKIIVREDEDLDQDEYEFYKGGSEEPIQLI